VTDPFDRLDASHRRHDEVMRELRDAIEQGDADAIDGALGFLGRSTPRHFADEEESLFPRVVARAPAMADGLDALAAQHREHEALHARLAGAAGDPARMLRALDALEDLHQRHVETEDMLFPALRLVLEPEDLAAIEDEMQGRRGRSRPIAIE
jgi:hemerythrin-like domain-containing protein